MRELAALNNIVSPYTIYPGQTLRLTGKAKLKPTSKTNAADSNKAVKSVTQNTNKNNSSQAKSNSSAKPAKAVAPKNQTGYVQTGTKKMKKLRIIP